MFVSNSIKSSLAIVLCALAAPTNGEAIDQWIDKSEDEDYTARHECSFVQAGDSFILFGGRESSQRLDTYDFANDTWSLGGEAPKEFNHFQATFYQGFVWVIGSFQNNAFPKEKPEDSVWLYSPVSKTWIQGPKFPEHRRRGGAGLVVYEDKFYILGGNTIGHHGGYVDWFDEYDPQTNRWTELESASQARDHFHAAVIEDKLYAAGGRKSGGEGGVFAPLVDVVDVYDFKNQSWATLDDNLPTPRAAPGIAVFNEKLFVMGGEGETKGPAYKVVEAYDPSNNQWTQQADMHHPRHGTQAIVSGKGIYLAGGSPNRGGGNQLNMEVYSEDTPKSHTIIPSQLAFKPKYKINRGTVTEIKIEAKNGNTGCFITKVILEGDSASTFKIESEPELTLLPANSKRIIKISHVGTQKGEEATLRIFYNGIHESITKLVSR